MSRWRRPSLGNRFGYTPGEQPPDGGGWIKLNTNESAQPPSPRVAEAVHAAAATLNRYPSPSAEPLRSELARRHGVDRDQVAVGNGGDGMLEACFRAFCEPGARVVCTSPTYSLLRPLCLLHSAQLAEVPLGEDGELPAQFADEPAALRFLVNPNSPTGTWIPPAEVARRLDNSAGVLVIDEAYCDFAPQSCVALLPAHPSWVVVRTFSKSYALAGLRVGYAVASAELIADLTAVADSYAVDRCAIAGAAAALADVRHHDQLVAMVRSERTRLTEGLRARGWAVVPSAANFVCASPPGGDAAAVAASLRQRHILVRLFGGASPGSSLRITVGTPTENDALLDALR